MKTKILGSILFFLVSTGGFAVFAKDAKFPEITSDPRGPHYIQKVKDVIDGKTILLENQLTVTLLGLTDGGRPAKDFLAKACLGKSVVIQSDEAVPNQAKSTGQLKGYVFLWDDYKQLGIDKQKMYEAGLLNVKQSKLFPSLKGVGLFVNATMILMGLCQADEAETYRFKEHFMELQLKK